MQPLQGIVYSCHRYVILIDSVYTYLGVDLEGYTLSVCKNWLLGYRAAGTISSLPDYIGRILLKGLEISRVGF